MASPSLANPLEQRTIALAALIQSVQLIEHIARTGMHDAASFSTCMDSILSEAPINHVIAHYHDLEHIRPGLLLASKIMHGAQLEKAKTIMLYTSAIMALEKRLQKQPAMLQELSTGIQHIRKQHQYFGNATHENILAAMADLYGRTLSQIKPRIIIHGSAEHLGQSSNKQKVRALLLAGVRAAYLWRSHGGSHLQLLIARKKLAKTIDSLLGSSVTS